MTKAWWSCVQACTWIATRDEDLTARAEKFKSLARADDYIGLRAAAYGVMYRPELYISGGAAETLAASCRRGEIAALGRRDDDGDLQAISLDDWRNLDIIDAGEPRGALTRPLRADRLGAKTATWWSCLFFEAAEVRRCWPWHEGISREVTADDLLGPMPALPTPDAAFSPSRQRRQERRASQAEHDLWYAGHRDALIAAGKSANSTEDERAGREVLGTRYDRDRARQARRKLAPAEWTSTAMRRGKR